MAGLGLSTGSLGLGHYNVEVGQRTAASRPSREGDNKISSVAFNPDGSSLATATHYSPLVAMYNTATWEEDVAWAEAMKTEPERGAQVAAFSPNGKWFMTGGEGPRLGIRRQRKRSLESRRLNHGLSRSVQMAECLAVGGQDGHLQLLNIPHGFVPVEHERVFVATGGGASISAVAFSPNENCLALRAWTGERASGTGR